MEGSTIVNANAPATADTIATSTTIATSATTSISTTTINTTETPVIITNANKHKSVNWRNQPQSIALVSGALIFLAAGLNLAQSLGWNEFEATSIHFYLSWFIGSIIGCILSIPLVLLIAKKYIMASCSCLILIDGIISVSAPESEVALIAARYLNGIAVGVVTITFLIHASEVAVKSYRGSCLAMEQYAISFGIIIQVIYISLWGEVDFPSNILRGIFDILFGLLAFISALIFTIESPVYYLRQGNETMALDCLARLERPKGIKTTTYALLEEHKSYLRENEKYDIVESFKLSLVPLVKLILYRSLMLTFGFSLPLTIAVKMGALLSLGPESWPFIVYAALRVFGSLITLFTVDTLGRKIISLLSLILIGALLIPIGIFFSNHYNVLDKQKMAIVCTLSLLIQFFAGIFAPNTSAYMGEAFPLDVKPYLLAVCVIAEHLINIIIISALTTKTTTIDSLSQYFLTAGIVIIFLFLLFCAVMPETRKTSLSQAQSRLQKLLYLKLY
uniref:Major facilitator superfamily (MFS) profile domain-containing protein n=1 Tax=Glossina brevipalpis TaxID=37001 RepID=A0A1A9W1W1_9MUSC